MKPNAMSELFIEKKGVEVDDFTEFTRRPRIDLKSAEEGTMSVYRSVEPWVESIDYDDKVYGIKGPKHERDNFRDTYKAIVAALLLNIARTPTYQLRKEATLAGTDVPTFTKQLIRTVVRAYPRLLAPQLFPIVPLNAPDGRIYFELLKYNSAFQSNSVGPTIASGDVVADLDKFNTDFGRQPNQLDNLGLVKLDLSNYITVSSQTYGVAAISSLQAEDDLQSIYGRDFNSTISDRMSKYLQWVIDRLLINTVVDNIPAGSKKTWKRQPTINGVTWANQLPSEKGAWRETIWRDGFLPVFTAIYNNYYVRPNWCIAGPSAAEDIMGLTQFVPIRVDDSTIDMRVGGIRDLGTLDAGGMRVFIDPQITASGVINPNLVIFGYRPMDDMEPAIVFCPYRAIGFTDRFQDPRNLSNTRGAYTRFAIGKPDASVPESAKLACCYGQLTISDAA